MTIRQQLENADVKTNDTFITDGKETYLVFGFTNDVILVHRCVIENGKLIYKRMTKIEWSDSLEMTTKPESTENPLLPVLTENEAKHVASNPDGVTLTALTAFLVWVNSFGKIYRSTFEDKMNSEEDFLCLWKNDRTAYYRKDQIQMIMWDQTG